MIVLHVLWGIVRVLLKIVFGILLLPLLILQCMIEFIGGVVGIFTGLIGGFFVIAGILLLLMGQDVSLCVFGIVFGSLFAVLPGVVAGIGSSLIGALQDLMMSI